MALKIMTSISDHAIHMLDVLLRRKLHLGENKFLRKFLLGPYRKLIGLSSHGVLMNMGGHVPVRMPPEYAWKIVEDYEPETISAINTWLGQAQNPVLIDVGCSLGFITCAGLFSNLGTHVIAIDSDLQSLKATQQICSLAPSVNDRLSLVWGFASDTPTKNDNYLRANQTTVELLKQPDISGNPESVHYVCLDSATDLEKKFPQHSLDNLLPDECLFNRPILIKIDVEGAELLVLKSGQRLLNRDKLVLLLSVHPDALPRYDANKDDVKAFLSKHGYVFKTIAVDHEEHWWCVKL